MNKPCDPASAQEVGIETHYSVQLQTAVLILVILPPLRRWELRPYIAHSKYFPAWVILPPLRRWELRLTGRRKLGGSMNKVILPPLRRWELRHIDLSSPTDRPARCDPASAQEVGIETDPDDNRDQKRNHGDPASAQEVGIETATQKPIRQPCLALW